MVRRKRSTMEEAVAGLPCRDRHGSDRVLPFCRAARGRAVLTLVIAVCLLLETQAATAAVLAGQVVALRGQCLTISVGQRRLLTIGAAVSVGDTMQTPAGARLKLRMRDGSIISVASGSIITIRDYAVDASGQRRNARLSLRLGLLRAQVTTSGSGEFEVETPVGIAAVRSTDWFISASAGAAQVGVLEGSVALTSRATDRSVAIPARWGGRLEAGLNPVPPRLWSRAEFADVIARTSVNE
jgi:hypothetical protein